MTVKKILAQAGFAALCAISLSPAVSGTAMAGSVTYPGELVGVAWAPLPEGVYAVNTSSFASDDRAVGHKSSIYVDIPVIAWSTPWTFLGGRVEAYVAGPFLGVYSSSSVGHVGFPPPPVLPKLGAYTNDFYNPFIAIGESWDLGHGFYIANFVGSYLPIDNALGQNYWTPNDRFAFGYTGDGWDLTAHTTFGLRTNDISTNLGTGDVAGTHGFDYINLDLTATKKLGKWEIGPVAYGSWDVGGNTTIAAYNNLLPFHGSAGYCAFAAGPGSLLGDNACAAYAKQGQFAVGGLVGYDFGGLYGQVYLTRDVWIHNYDAYQTNIFGRIIIPLWNPPVAPKPLVSKY